MSERWGDSKRDRDELDRYYLTRDMEDKLERDLYYRALREIASQPNYPAKSIADAALADTDGPDSGSSLLLRILEAGNALAAVVTNLAAGSDEEGNGTRAIIAWQHTTTAVKNDEQAMDDRLQWTHGTLPIRTIERILADALADLWYDCYRRDAPVAAQYRMFCEKVVSGLYVATGTQFTVKREYGIASV